MPTGAHNDMVPAEAGADARRLRALRKLLVAAGLMTALNWIAVLARILGGLPLRDGWYDTPSIPLVMIVLWYVSSSSMIQLRYRKWAMASLAAVIVAGLFFTIGAVIELSAHGRWPIPV